MKLDKPEPEPDAVSAFYWEAARESTLVIQRCQACGRYLHPPGVVCPACLSEDLVPTEVSGRGRVYAYTVAHQAFDAAFSDDVPYLLALVELDEQPGLRMLTNLVGATAADVESGAPVEVTYETRGNFKLPQFRLA
ncbi:MAG: Zn-ribbon domain-containing OB-fold protein [Acidimicrobiaceae bacterium]|nr:Zn-ribbon domain-containing OB-fold protein [Acidimicrobiaceae bacterium]